jgi:hypothetical protein
MELFFPDLKIEDKEGWGRNTVCSIKNVDQKKTVNNDQNKIINLPP